MAEETNKPGKKKPAKKKETPIDLVSLNKMASAGYKPPPGKGARIRHSKFRQA